jgi:hypothetical protein
VLAVVVVAQVLLEQERLAVRVHIVHFQDHLSLMRVVVVVQLTQAHRVLVVLVAAVMAVRLVALTALLEQLTQVVVAVQVTTQEVVVILEQAVQASLSFHTLAHKEAQAAQSHQAVATPFIHSHLAVHLQLN